MIKGLEQADQTLEFAFFFKHILSGLWPVNVMIGQ